MLRYDIDQTCDFCSMSQARYGEYVDYSSVEAAVTALVDHLWDSHPSNNLRDKAKLDSEVRSFFN